MFYGVAAMDAPFEFQTAAEQFFKCIGIELKNYENLDVDDMQSMSPIGPPMGNFEMIDLFYGPWHEMYFIAVRLFGKARTYLYVSNRDGKYAKTRENMIDSETEICTEVEFEGYEDDGECKKCEYSMSKFELGKNYKVMGADIRRIYETAVENGYKELVELMEKRFPEGKLKS